MLPQADLRPLIKEDLLEVRQVARRDLNPFVRRRCQQLLVTIDDSRRCSPTSTTAAILPCLDLKARDRIERLRLILLDTRRFVITLPLIDGYASKTKNRYNFVCIISLSRFQKARQNSFILRVRIEMIANLPTRSYAQQRLVEFIDKL